MKKDKEVFTQMVYELWIGVRNLEEYPVEESEVVRDEFGEGMYCSDAYEKVYRANHRLCDRLNTEEDADVECIISNLLGIAEHLSMKMFSYGDHYARRKND